MNLFKKFLLILCIAISAQPAYGWGWNSINLSSVGSLIKSYASPILKTVSENKVAAAGLGLALLGTLAFSKYAYAKNSDNKKQPEEPKNLGQPKSSQVDRYGNPMVPVQKQESNSKPIFDRAFVEYLRKKPLNQAPSSNTQPKDDNEIKVPTNNDDIRVVSVSDVIHVEDSQKPEPKKPDSNNQVFQKDGHGNIFLVDKRGNLLDRQPEKPQKPQQLNRDFDENPLNTNYLDLSSAGYFGQAPEQENNDNQEDPNEDLYRSYRVSHSSVNTVKNDDNNEEPFVKKIVSSFNLSNLFASHRTPDFLKKEKEKKENEDLLGFEEDVIPVDDFIVVKKEEHVDDQPIAKYFNQTFHHKKCPSMSELAKLITGINDYCDLIKPGANLAWDLLAGTFDYNTVGGARVYNLDNNNRKALEHKHRNEYLGDIVSLCWFMYSLALHKDKIFEEGSFIVHDNGKIFNYLLNYVNKVNSKENKHPVHHSESPYGCCRASSHLIKWQKQGNKHFGIDIRFGRTPMTSRSNILPTGKSHILFGKLDDNRTFIKMEENGVYKYDGLLSHAGNFIVAQARKTPVVNWFTGTDDAPTFCKERIPLEIVSDAQAVGINKIDAIDDIVQAYKKDNTGKYDKLMGKIIKLYPHDFEGRIGNEVILTPSDLQWSYFYHPEATQDDKKAIRDIVRIKYLIKWYADFEGQYPRGAKEIQEHVKSFESPAKLPELNNFVKTNNIIKQIMNESPYTTHNIVCGPVSQN